MTKKRYTIKPGQYVIIPEITARGGISYNREKEARRKKGDGYRQDIHSRKTVDHEEIVDRADKIRETARYVLRANATKTAIGWVADAEGLRKIHDGFTARGSKGKQRHYPGFVTLAERAATLNRGAVRAGSERRVQVSYVELDIQLDNERAARAIARTVRENCESLMTACRTGKPSEIQTALNRCKNMDRLAVGFQKTSIQFAIDCAKRAREDLRKVCKDAPKSQHLRLMVKAAKRLDLDEIEACVGNFADWDNEDEGSMSLAM